MTIDMGRGGDTEPGELPTDRVLVRGLRDTDLPYLVRIDRAAMGRAREEYYRAKLREALKEGKLTTSLVAELDDHPVGFVLSRVYYGEFGHAEAVAVLDTIGVDPAYRGRSVAKALLRQLVMNLRALDVERLETQVDWGQFELLRFLHHEGFSPAPRICLRQLL